MNKILKEKIKNIIITKDSYTKEEIQLILWYLKNENGNILDNLLNSIKKIINFINSNIKE